MSRPGRARLQHLLLILRQGGPCWAGLQHPLVPVRPRVGSESSRVGDYSAVSRLPLVSVRARARVRLGRLVWSRSQHSQVHVGPNMGAAKARLGCNTHQFT